MFENLLYQEQISATLKEALKQGRLPRSLLFSGPACSGKTTAALELARSLSCVGQAEWNCPCPACERHRRLVHSDLMIAGPDDLGPEIAAALGMLERSQNKRELYAFLRSIRKLTRRFDPDLWAGEESKLSKASVHVLAIEELLSDLDPGSPKAEPLTAATRASEEALKLIALLPASLPVFMVRNASAWSRLSSSGKRKCLIIENADSMLDSSRNALLKLLEEPPENLVIVLTTCRKSALIETILSRLRDLSFRERSAQESTEILTRIFALPEALFHSIPEYLESFSDFPREKARECARGVLAEIFYRAQSRGSPSAMDMSQALGAQESMAKIAPTALERRNFPILLRAILNETGAILRACEGNINVLSATENWASLIRDAALRAGSYNQSPDPVLRALIDGMESGL